MIKDVKDYLYQMSDIKTRDFSSKLIKTNLPILGIKTPVLRDFAKKIAKNNYTLFLNENDYSSYEIVLLAAFVIGYSKMPLEQRFSYLDDFIPKIDNWAVHDGLVSTLKFTKKNKQEVFKYLSKYFTSEKEYEVRFVAIMLMTYYLDDDYIEEDFKIIKSLFTKDYYAKMGVAWFLATAAIKYPSRVYDYLLEENDIELIKMTIRKIKDSYRIDSDFKNQIAKVLR